MTKILRIMLILIFAASVNSVSAKDKSRIKWYPLLSFGYLQISSNYVHDYFDKVVLNYTNYGVPLITQTTYGRTILLNTGLSISLSKKIRTGISVGYLYSPAYSKYEDYAGAIKIKAAVKSFELGLFSQAELTRFWEIPFHITLKAGANYSSLSISQQAIYNNNLNFNFNENYSGETWGEFIEATFGPSFSTEYFNIQLDLGYRLCEAVLNKKPIYSHTINYELTNEKWNIGQDGILFVISLSKEL